MINIKNVSRRGFLKGAGVAGSGLALAAFGSGSAAAAPFPPDETQTFKPNVFIAIEPNGQVHITVARTEMGQGTRTAMSQLIVEELEVDIHAVELHQGDADPRYGNQYTEGSTSVRTQWEPLRQAGAVARTMLVTAAAEMMGVGVGDCIAKNGEVICEKKNRRIAYGKLTQAAAALAVPKEVKLKDTRSFEVIGQGVPGLDLDNMVQGKQDYGMDFRLPGMVFASVERCPVKDGSIKSVDDKKALAVNGVRKVLTIEPFGPPANTFAGVVVLANSTWAALKGRKALKVEWDLGKNAAMNTEELTKALHKSVQEPGEKVRTVGDTDAILAASKNVVEARYDAPYLVHAPMEPLVATARVDGDSAEVWMPTQTPGWSQETAAKALGIPKEKVTIHVNMAGGGFGRKSKPDVVTEAVLIAKQAGMPVKVVWSREDEIRHGFYRSQSCQLLKAALDQNGNPEAWVHRTAFPSILSLFGPSPGKPAGWELGQGATNIAYQIPNVSMEACAADSPLRIGWLRSVHHTFHAWAVNCFVDELAATAKRDPIEYHRDLIGEPQILEFSDRDKKSPFKFDTGRLLNVIDLVKKHSDWGKTLPKGRGLGFATHHSFHSYVAMVADVSVDDAGALRVNRYVAVVDCGVPVNPDSIKAQVEGSVVFALSAALYGNITVNEGRVVQSNFHDYPMLRINEMPEVEVHIVKSEMAPTGIGEPGVPPAAPALCNAIHAAIGKRFYSMPLPKKLV